MHPASATVPGAPPDPQFGHLVSEWRAGLKQRILLTIIILLVGGLFVGLGIAEDIVALWTIAGAVALILLCLLYFQQSGVRVTVYTHGIQRQGRFGTKRVGWTDLQSYQLQILDMAVVIAAQGGLIGAAHHCDRAARAR